MKKQILDFLTNRLTGWYYLLYSKGYYRSANVCVYLSLEVLKKHFKKRLLNK